MWETDPLNLQPKLRPLNRQVAEYLRAHPPVDFDQARFYRVLDVVETPWSRREENQLRAAWNAECDSSAAQALSLIEVVEETGIEPFEPPQPLLPIEQDEVNLICWMAISAQEGEHAEASWAAPQQTTLIPDRQRVFTE